MNRSVKIIACGVLEEEIRAAAERLNITIDEEYLPAGLHEQPERLKQELQAAVNRAAAEYDAVVIGYGLCGRGTVGLQAGSVPLVMPRVHDCIAMFLGSQKRYKEQFSTNPGTPVHDQGLV